MSWELDPCRVHAESGELVADGVVREQTSASLVVDAEHFTGVWLDPGDVVVAQVLSTTRGALTYDARVASSETGRIELVDLRLRDAVQQRSAVRVATSLPVAVREMVVDGQRTELETPLAVTVLDLSAGGARVHAAEELAAGTRLVLDLELGRPLRLVAEVLRTAPGRTGFLHGCRFDQIREREADEIFSFVLAEQRRQRANHAGGR